MPTTGMWMVVEPVGFGEVESILTSLETRVANVKGAVPALYATFRKIEQYRFEHEGPGWAPLALATRNERIRLGLAGDRPILDRSGNDGRYDASTGRTGGQLRRSLTTAHATNARLRVEVGSIFMGTSDPVAKYHQYGTRKMDARPLVDMSEGDATAYADVIAKYLFGFYGTSVIHMGIGVNEMRGL